MRFVIFGGSGMLGKALIKEGQTQGHEIIAPTRAEVNLTDDSRIEEFLLATAPECVINAAAMINHTECEENPRSAYMINARPVATLANVCRDLDIDLVQISSDQCAYPLLNEYAKTKAAGERFALSYSNALVVRTNIVGPQNLAWALEAIETDAFCTLYNNYIVSSIDVWTFSQALFEILKESSAGIINIACRESFSKEAFVRALAKAMGFPLSRAITGSVTERHPQLKLDVSLAEKWLGRKLPTLKQVINTIVKERNQYENWHPDHRAG
jgi:dTDP-4-dehydrorhamnose reductase